MKKKIFSSLLMAAFVFASVGTFVSCKDYDDDISSNTDAITALQTQLSALQTALDQAKTDATTAHANFVTQTELGNTESAMKEAAKEAAATAKSEAISDAVSQCEGLIAGKASKDDLNSLSTKVDGIDEALNKLPDNIATTDDVEAAKNNLQEQIDALNYLKEILPKGTTLTDKLGDIQTLKDEVEKTTMKVDGQDVTGLKEIMNAINDKVNNFSSDINVLQYLVNKILTSVALLPDLYIDGIEAIEFKSLYYLPVKAGTSGNELEKDAKAVIVDNGMAEATYRLNPSSVLRETIDEENIEFKAAVAETRNSYVDSPVKFNGIASFENGLMKVNLKKTVTTSLQRTDGKIYIVSLKVPRKADADKGVEAADIYSENSRLSETYFTPQIAALPFTACPTWAGTQHYSDSTDIYNSAVDANDLVTKEVNYKGELDLTTLVTGCYDRNYTTRSSSTHNQITKDELKKYGIAFRFAIPSTEYKKDVDNTTNQQKFIYFSDAAKTKVKSQTPAGLKDNAAVIGKEPIVRVDMVDIVNNKLVDQRYMKIKWIDNKLDAVQLDNKASEVTLSCDDMKASYTWEEFVNNIYAKAENMKGLSQSTFETIYPFAKITYTDGSFSTNWKPTPASGTFSVAPVFANTTNENGDALIGTWTFTPDDVEQVYNSSAADTKTFRYKVTFKSEMPSQYPDLWFYWDVTVKLPTLPSINGYYDQYWFEKYETVDIYPVQYNTAAQTLAYCVYDNNLMNNFTYEQVNNAPKFIVKNIPECGTWDMQFSLSQPVSGYAPKYASATATEPDKDKEAYATFKAYQLYKGNVSTGTKALQLNWDEGHTSWCGNIDHKAAKLFADHKNQANWDLINPLGDSSTDTKTTLGLTVPGTTHEKKVNVSVWATLNNYNYIPVKKFAVCLVAPLRVNAVLEGSFEDGHVSGTEVDVSNAFTMTDFRGYKVAETKKATDVTEQTKYADVLYKYYEVETPKWNLDAVRYTFENSNGNVVINNNLTAAQSMTSAKLTQLTNGNIDLSITQSGTKLIFKNNGGSNIEAQCYAYIPYTVTYGFGEITGWVKVPVYPAK